MFDPFGSISKVTLGYSFLNASDHMPIMLASVSEPLLIIAPETSPDFS